MQRAAFEAGATLLHSFSRQFSPQGVTVLTVVAESHLSLHTWPEKGYAAIDVFTCGETTAPIKAVDYLRGILRPTTVEIVSLQRGARRGVTMTSFSKSGTYCKLG